MRSVTVLISSGEKWGGLWGPIVSVLDSYTDELLSDKFIRNGIILTTVGIHLSASPPMDRT